MTAISSLPYEIADDMRWCAWAVSWYTSNTRFLNRGDLDDLDKFYGHFYSFKHKSLADGILSESTCDSIRRLFWSQAWFCANTRKGYTGDAQTDEQSIGKYLHLINDSGEVTSTLADNIQMMGSHAAWHCANIRADYSADAESDKQMFEEYFKKMYT